MSQSPSATPTFRSRSGTPRERRIVTTAEEERDSLKPSGLQPDLAALAPGVDAAVARIVWRSREDALPEMHWWLCVVLDALLWFALYWRDYGSQGMYHMTISHYMLVITVSDAALYMLPHRCAHWGYPFRIFSGIQLFALTLQLFRFGIDSTSVAWSLLRILLCLARAIHGAWVCKVHGPNTSEEGVAIIQYVVSVKGAPNRWLPTVLYFILLASPLSSTHYNYGQHLVDGPLAGFQAGDALGAFLKLWVCEGLIRRALPRAMLAFALGASLLVQWPFMWDMYAMAPWPYFHIGAELSLFLKGYKNLQSHWKYGP
jgi:hypothetical protein